ncbi:MAG: hypothetical protein UY57_C0010G0003 [Candidatus Kaiserbacteria bacterium GW2011_GWB1_50_17]|uniref:NAD-dependent epimerase/dehydratase domain-containing protein n=1 Tax=Candidatus Kaiserbacteria bacterium GW2011_GWB1_50_17 TaxID=1618673 RepID=A0A0G1WG50_9BACT|nr:MAG: hypothetical protein UY57_C0010G0003 [Candidatus Kaiserbacteria bacterium GW2011_GWB1_50_17]
MREALILRSFLPTLTQMPAYRDSIVVTGGLGHIGSRLIRSLGSDFSEIRIIDNLATQRYASRECGSLRKTS